MRTEKLQKIRKLSRILRVLCTGLLAFIVLVGAGSVVDLAFGIGGVNFAGVSYGKMIFTTAELSLAPRLFLAALGALAFASLFKGFYHLRRLFGNYTRGEIFTREAVGELRQFGVGCLLWGVMSQAWVLSLVLLLYPSRSFEGHLDSLGVGAVIIAIAWFMEMAVDLREENELTI